MGREQTGAWKHICVCFACLIFLSNCAMWEEIKCQGEEGALTQEETKGRGEPGAVIAEKKEDRQVREHLLYGQKLLARGDYEDSLKVNQWVLSISCRRPPGDEALFTIGSIYAHPRNPKKTYGRALQYFKEVIKDYPQSPWAEQARIWAAVLQEIEKLNQETERLKQEIGRSNQALEKSNQTHQRLNEVIRQLNEVIERSRQVDLEIEEKKREKAR